MFESLQIIAGVAIIFFLPGYTLVNMLFPRKGELDPEYDWIYRAALGMGMSVVISILVGFLLNSISTEEHPYVTAGPLWTVLLSLTGIFTLVGWLRGAYPNAGVIHPSLYRPFPDPGVPRSRALGFRPKLRMERLLMERQVLLDDMKKFSERSSTLNSHRKSYYRKRIDQARTRVDQINSDLDRIEKGGK
jgi:hypothetical protein